MSYIRVRQRNQLTLPKEISAALQVKEGDFLEVSTSENAIILRPTRIVKFGTPEGEAEARRAEQSFREGRYRTFDSVESFAKALGLPAEAQAKKEAVDKSVELTDAGRGEKAARERLELESSKRMEAAAVK